jgi:hypothetical protein
MSKGSLPKPYSVDLNTFNNNWDNIFRKPDPRIIEDQKNEDEAFEQIASQTEVNVSAAETPQTALDDLLRFNSNHG